MNYTVKEELNLISLHKLEPGDVFVIDRVLYMMINDNSLLKFYCNCDRSFCEYKPDINPYAIMAVDLRTGGVKSFARGMRVNQVKNYNFEVTV